MGPPNRLKQIQAYCLQQKQENKHRQQVTASLRRLLLLNIGFTLIVVSVFSRAAFDALLQIWSRQASTTSANTSRRYLLAKWPSSNFRNIDTLQFLKPHDGFRPACTSNRHYRLTRRLPACSCGFIVFAKNWLAIRKCPSLSFNSACCRHAIFGNV